MIIELQDEKTWPDEILKLLENNLDVLENSQSYEIDFSSLLHAEKEGFRNQFKAEFDNNVGGRSSF